MFYFALNKAETEIPASNLFLGANLTEGIGLKPVRQVKKLSIHCYLCIKNIIY